MQQASGSRSQPPFAHHPQHNGDEDQKDDGHHLGDWAACRFSPVDGSPPHGLVLASLSSWCLLNSLLLVFTSPSSSYLISLGLTSNLWFVWDLRFVNWKQLVSTVRFVVKCNWKYCFVYDIPPIYGLEIVENVSNEVILKTIECSWSEYYL